MKRLSSRHRRAELPLGLDILVAGAAGVSTSGAETIGSRQCTKDLVTLVGLLLRLLLLLSVYDYVVTHKEGRA